MFVDSTPFLAVALENPFLGRRYPKSGTAHAVLDTGYDGFVVLPDDIFHYLGLDEMSQDSRALVLANGNQMTSKGSYSSLHLLDAPATVDGLVETCPGVDEILLGTAAIRQLKVELDYCLRRVRLEMCR
ncbi:MAG: clan AA aspartic protease [Nitrososphaerales archaeon]|nr:clan AA aspartic protease [Nitrososphaerales archaeon]